MKIQEWIPDIRDAYNNGKIFIAPMRIGTGLQNKLLEAMSLQLPCITTNLANMGLGAEHNKELFIAENDQDFIDVIKKLLENQESRAIIGKNARAFVKRKFNWEKTSNEILENLTFKRT